MKAVSLTILLLCCAAPVLVAQEKKTLQQEVQEFAEAVRKHLKRQEAAFTEEAKATREVVNKMSADVTAQSKLMQALQAKMQELERELTKVTLENAKLRKSLDEQEAKLRQEIAAERQVRASNDQKIVKELSSAIGKTTLVTDPNPVKPSPANTRQYTVQKGDTLSAIALAFNTSIGKLKAANNLTDASKIRVGQQLVIPE